MKRIILQAVMVCLGFVSDLFNLKKVRAKEGIMKGKVLFIGLAMVLFVFGGIFEIANAADLITVIDDETNMSEGPACGGNSLTLTINGGSDFVTTGTISSITFTDSVDNNPVISVSSAIDRSDSKKIKCDAPKYDMPTSENRKLFNVKVTISVTTPIATYPYTSTTTYTYAGTYTYKAIPNTERAALLSLNNTSIGWNTALPRGSEGEWLCLEVTCEGED